MIFRRLIKTMKKKNLSLGIFLLALLICIPILASCSSSGSGDHPISPALSYIAEQSFMAKSAIKGNAVSFSAEDFARAVNLNNIDSITITSLPPVSDGELRVGSSVLTSAQTLSAASISLMTYHPSADISSSEFRFTVNGSPVEMCCKLYMLDKENYAPTLSLAPKTALEVSTHQNVTLYGSLPCYDPDGDDTYIEIVSYPQKGLLILEDVQTGSYRYLPYADSTGKDSFIYVAKDKYGNYSPSAEVSLSINKSQTPVTYVDLNASPYYNAALTMTEKGIMSGTQVGSSVYFYPENTVSRAEFTVMAMNAAGITNINPCEQTVFADDADIPSHMKSYIAAAYDMGYIKGSEIDGKLCFLPTKEITRAEAAVMLANMLDAAAPTVTPVFDDSDEIPTWAQASIYSLSFMGVLESNGNNISPASAVTRGDAAEILVNFMEVK